MVETVYTYRVQDASLTKWLRKVFRHEKKAGPVTIDQKKARAARLRARRVTRQVGDLEQRMNAMERELLGRSDE